MDDFPPSAWPRQNAPYSERSACRFRSYPDTPDGWAAPVPPENVIRREIVEVRPRVLAASRYEPELTQTFITSLT